LTSKEITEFLCKVASESSPSGVSATKILN